MAKVTRTVHVKVLAFDPAQATMVPVPGATLLCEDSGWLWDPNLSEGSPTTDANGVAAVELSFDEEKESALNPFFTITLSEGSRAVPAGAPAPRQITLPDEWVTRHYVERRIPNISQFTDPTKPLELFVGLDAELRVSYADFDPSGLRNPLALPQDTVRIYLSDYDEFLWIDCLNPDDTLHGFTFDPVAEKIVPAGEKDEYPYFDAWPTAPFAFDGAPAAPRAWTDPPGAPVGTLGGGSFLTCGPLATDAHGFVFTIDGNVIRRFYPDGTLCETIPDPSAFNPLSNPSGIALDQHRTLYVADTGNDRIVVFRPRFSAGDSGRYVDINRPFGTTGSGNGQFSRPVGLAVLPNRVVDGDELLAVADAGNQRVQVLRIEMEDPTVATGGAPSTAIRAIDRPNAHLSFVCAFGLAGAGAGQFGEPVGVAADRERRLYVCDRQQHRVSRWAPDAAAAPTTYTHQVDWEKTGGGSGNGSREFNAPESIAADLARAYVYVAEPLNQRVQRLDAETGNHLASWAPTYTPPLAAPFTPLAVAVDPRGEVYAADATNQRIVRATTFEPAGAPRADGVQPLAVGAPWTPSTAPGHMSQPRYVAYGPDGTLWVADTGNDRILAFKRNAAGEMVTAPAPAPAGLSRPLGVAAHTDGALFVVDTGNSRVRHYDAAGAHLADFGVTGVADGEFVNPRGIAIVPRTPPLLFVADQNNDRVQIFRLDGTFVDKITTADGTPLDRPEDVAADARGHVYIADTANGRIVQLDDTNAFVKAFTVAVPGGTAVTRRPCGISVDPDGKLIVTDRAQDTVFRTEPDGTLLAYWNLDGLLEQQTATATTTQRLYYPERRHQVVFDAPGRAVLDGQGLLAVADTGHDRVRLLRAYTSVKANLFDLGERLPDISFRAVTKANWFEELGLEVNVGDVSIFDDSHDFSSKPEDDFARDHYRFETILGPSRHTNAAINTLRVVREVQRWYQHHTRRADNLRRWGTAQGALAQRARTLDVDLFEGDGTMYFLDVNLGDDSEGSVHGRGADAWDDGVVAHEMSHWVFGKNVAPYPMWPLNPFRWIDISRTHVVSQLMTMNQVLSEGWASYVQLFWGEEFDATDQVRGVKMATTLSAVNEKGQPDEYLAGGLASAAVPTFNQPGRGLRSQGYFTNALYQIHRALTDPGVQFADAPSYWSRFNVHISDEQSKRFSDTIWKALERFRKDPPFFDKASQVFLTTLLDEARVSQPAFAQVVQSIFELNNQLMPTVTITRGSSDTAPGSKVGEKIEANEGDAVSLVVQVKDATDRPLSGYRLHFAVDEVSDWEFRPTVDPATALRGRVRTGGLTRATNANGIVRIVFEAPPGSANRVERLTVSYQPDFDTDATFAPPSRGDDLETTLRRLYLYELRAAAKTWAGPGSNFGATVSDAVRLEVQAP